MKKNEIKRKSREKYFKKNRHLPQITVTETWMYQSDAIRQKLVAFAYSVQAGGGAAGCAGLLEASPAANDHERTSKI